MNTLSWIGLCFIAFNFIFISIIAIIYVREQWKYVDEEMAEAQREDAEFKERLKLTDELLGDIFKNIKSLL